MCKLPDDVAIGIILKNKNKIIKKRLDISSKTLWQSGDKTIFINNLLTEKKIKKIDSICKKSKIFHIRIKTENRYKDAKHMKKLFKYYYKNSKE